MQKILKDWLDAICLIAGMVFIDLGGFLFSVPIGFLVLGLCFVIMAVLIAKKHAG
jgi:hypothetical protein